MKISVVQISPKTGALQENIELHVRWINAAIAVGADFILFPELSLTAYDSKLACQMAMNQDDSPLDDFQNISNLNKTSIGIGIPVKAKVGIYIGMVIFQPSQPRTTYLKQILDPDEIPYFINGTEQLVLNIEDRKIAPAICYESLQPDHAEDAHALGAEIYLVSVAMSSNGIEKGYSHYSEIARRFSMPVLMSNCIGRYDNFQSAGQSAIWNEKGEILAKLGSDKEGLLLFDTVSGKGKVCLQNVQP